MERVIVMDFMEFEEQGLPSSDQEIIYYSMFSVQEIGEDTLIGS